LATVTASAQTPVQEVIEMKPHRGINTSSIAGDGLDDLPGALIAVAFVFMFVVMFAPRSASNWLFLGFILLEAGVAALFLLGKKRDRQATDQLRKEFHRLNEDEPPHK
jgi:hypothetical protein